MSTRDAYRFDPETREYLGTEKAYEDYKHEGEYILPENCTFAELPEFGEFEIPVFDGTSQWSVSPDYRKKPYYLDSDYWWAEPQYMSTYGDIPEGCSFDRYEKPQIVLDVIGLQGQYDALVEELQATDYYARRIYEYGTQETCALGGADRGPEDGHCGRVRRGSPESSGVKEAA